MITIIQKIDLNENGEQQAIDIGYTQNIHLINEINEQYDASLGVFVGGNMTKLENGIVFMSTFFETIKYVHQARTSIESIEGMNLKEITSINQL